MSDLAIRLANQMGREVTFVLSLFPDCYAHDRWVATCLSNGHCCYEPEVTAVLLRVLQPGDFALDIGAGIGWFTLMMSQLVGEQGRVLAFEPTESTYERLRSHLALNNIMNVEAHRKALWKTDTTLPFYLNDDDITGSCAWNPADFFSNIKTREKGAKNIEVQACALDTVLQSANPKLIKSDTEGAELVIFQGMHDLNVNTVPYIVLELNPFGMQELGSNTEELRSYLWQRGYDAFFIAEDRLPALIPPNTIIRYLQDMVVKNVLFTSIENVGKAWPEAMT